MESKRTTRLPLGVKHCEEGLCVFHLQWSEEEIPNEEAAGDAEVEVEVEEEEVVVALQEEEEEEEEVEVGLQ